MFKIKVRVKRIKTTKTGCSKSSFKVCGGMLGSA